MSSCSAASVEELLSPPKLDGEQTEIYNALRNFTNGDIILKYPKSGQYRSAFVVKNLDNEASDEAVVFYEIPNISDGSSLRLNFLDKQDGRWVSVYDFAASGGEVESVRFEDLGLGSVTMIVNYLMQSTSDRYTSVMTYTGGLPAEIMNVRNIYMDIFDADGSGTDDLFTIVNDRVSGVAAADIYGAAEGAQGTAKLAQLGHVSLNSGFAGIKNVLCGCATEQNSHALFIDYVFSDGSFGSDAVIYSGRYFYLAPALDPDVTFRNVNTYTPYIPCRDVDGDGSVEIPYTKPFPEYTELSRAEQVNMTVWCSLERGGTSLAEKYRSFVGTKGDYVFLFPDNWGAVTASVSISDSVVAFNRYDSISGIRGEELLRIYGSPDGGTPKTGEGAELISLGRSELTGYSYYALLTSSDFTPTEEMLGTLFRLQ